MSEDRSIPQSIEPEAMPGIAVADTGQVILDGPDGVAVALTPEAAAETGRRLIAAAEEAARYTVTDEP